VEVFPDLLEKYARRTVRLGKAQATIAFALGGQAGSRLASKLHMPISGDTLLRIIRKTSRQGPAEPEVIGVDDWAKRRGRVYGTILVDLEHHRVIDLLPDRTAETLAQWLRNHRGVRIVARDRSLEYARGISAGAPQAIQVADRWHLLVNLREALERLLDRLRPELNALLPAGFSAKSSEVPILGTVLAREKQKSPDRLEYNNVRRSMQKSSVCKRKNSLSARSLVNWARVPPRSTSTWRCWNFLRKRFANRSPEFSIRIRTISTSVGSKAIRMRASCGVKSN
jgi:transposase